MPSHEINLVPVSSSWSSDIIGEMVQILINLMLVDNSFDIPLRNNGINKYLANFLF